MNLVFLVFLVCLVFLGTVLEKRRVVIDTARVLGALCGRRFSLLPLLSLPVLVLFPLPPPRNLGLDALCGRCVCPPVNFRNVLSRFVAKRSKRLLGTVGPRSRLLLISSTVRFRCSLKFA